MHRIDSSGALASLPAPASPGSTSGYFTGGNPGLGQAATIVSHDWLNAVQEELLAVVAAAGLTPSKTTRTQLLTSLEKLFRQKLTSNLILYVAQSGNDANDGLTSATPFATKQAAWNALSRYDFAGAYIATINVAHGSYTDSVVCSGMPVGYPAGAAVYWTGDAGNPAAVSIACASTNGCFCANVGALIFVNGFQVSATGTAVDYVAAGWGLEVANGGIILCDNIFFDSCSYSQMQNFGFGGIIGAAYAGANIRFSGTSFLGLNCGAGGLIQFADANVNWNSPTYTGSGSAFANALGGGVIQLYNLTKTGSFTGKRFQLSTGATIVTAGQATTYFPGTIDGSGSILSGSNYNGGFYI